MHMDESIKKMEDALAKKKEARLETLRKRVVALEERRKKKDEKIAGLQAEREALDEQIRDVELLIDGEATPIMMDNPPVADV